jgi:hypothetical protein
MILHTIIETLKQIKLANIKAQKTNLNKAKEMNRKTKIWLTLKYLMRKKSRVQSTGLNLII